SDGIFRDSISDVAEFFFFQAEDGIRDFHVTGVQTCALPIWRRILDRIDLMQIFDDRRVLPDGVVEHAVDDGRHVRAHHPCGLFRSEERRVGKEWSSRWAPYPGTRQNGLAAHRRGEELRLDRL